MPAACLPLTTLLVSMWGLQERNGDIVTLGAYVSVPPGQQAAVLCLQKRVPSVLPHQSGWPLLGCKDSLCSCLSCRPRCLCTGTTAPGPQT